MNPTRDIIITQDEETIEKKAISINNLIRGVELNDLLEIHYDLQSLEVLEKKIPIYEIFNEYLASHKDNVGLADCILLYKELDKKIPSNVDTIKIDSSVSEKYSKVIVDFTKNKDIKIINETQRGAFHSLPSNLLANFKLIIFVIITTIKSISVFNQDNLGEDIIIIPIPGRTYHLENLLQDLGKFSVLTTDPKNTKLCNQVKIYNAVRSLILIRTLLEVFISTTVSTKPSTLIHSLEDQINNEFHVNIPNTIKLTVSNVYSFHNIQAIWKYKLYSKIFYDGKYDAVIVGGLSMPMKAALLAAENNDIKSFYLPHSITMPFHPEPPSDSIFFVTESTDIDYWIHRISHSSLRKENLISTGRLDLQNNSNKQLKKSSGESSLNILLATQPGDDKIRVQFVESVLNTVKNKNGIRTKIKIHPNENIEFYNNFNLDILDSDLHQAINWADIVITINSNVGIISLAKSTPVCSVNLCVPRRTPPIYVLDGPIPMLETEKEISKFFTHIDKNTIESLLDEQSAFFNNTYHFPYYYNKLEKEIPGM